MQNYLNRFVKSTETNESNPHVSTSDASTGEEIRQFYKDMISETSSSSTNDSKKDGEYQLPPLNRVERRRAQKKNLETSKAQKLTTETTKQLNNRFFTHVQNGDEDEVRPDELSFAEGDIIYVTDNTSSAGWWKAKINGKQGLIPSNYVSESSEPLDYPLHEACKRGNMSFLEECIKNKVSVNGLDKSGSTPLYWASHSGCVPALQTLLAQSNVCVDSQNKLGDTPLHAAAWKGHTECVKMLINAGANPNHKNRERKLPEDLCSEPEAKALLKRISSTFVSDNYADYANSSDEDIPEQ